MLFAPRNRDLTDLHPLREPFGRLMRSKVGCSYSYRPDGLSRAGPSLDLRTNLERGVVVDAVVVDGTTTAGSDYTPPGPILPGCRNRTSP